MTLRRFARINRKLIRRSASLAAAYILCSVANLNLSPLGAHAFDGAAKPVVDSRGLLVHSITSPLQQGTTKIRVLLPQPFDKSANYAALYLLPVEPRDEQRWGDPVAEILEHDLHNKHQLICVLPTFSHLPWYADHPERPEIRQESYFLQVVVPLVENTYPVIESANRRLLVGFSKSGCGAFSLLLRHPEMFGRAAAWDAPMMMDAPNRFGMKQIFGTQENFGRYQITSLLRQRAAQFSGKPRLGFFGYANFREHHQSLRGKMADLKISHVYKDGPSGAHSWNSGWLPEAVGFLVDEPGNEHN